MRIAIMVFACIVVAAMAAAGRVYQEASAAIQQKMPIGSNFCGTRTEPMKVWGLRFAPESISASAAVLCSRRVAWLKATACLVRYGSAKDTTPKVAECKSVSALMGDRLLINLRVHCHYTTYEYLWILEMHAYVRGLSGATASTTDFSWPVEARCF